MAIYIRIFSLIIHAVLYALIAILWYEKRIFSGAQPTGHLHIENGISAPEKIPVHAAKQFESFFAASSTCAQ